MAQEIINVGAAPNDGQGDPVRDAFIKCNNNFTELFSGSSSNAISNGNSVVQISTANGNISMSVSGTSNVAVVTTTGITVSNTLTAANIDAVNLVINNISSDDSTFITIEDGVIVNGVISAVDSITGGNILTAGNVTGAFFIGDGSQLTNLPAGNYSNANVAAYLPTYSGNITASAISAAGNIEGANMRAAGNVIVTGVVNANVLHAASGNIGVPSGVTTLNLGNNVATTINFGGNASNIFMANVNSTTRIAGNLTVGSTVSATGNITGNFILGNGSQLTGITANYSNANVAAYLPTYSGNITANAITATGNVTANNFIGSGAGTPTLSSATNLDLSANVAVRVTGGGTFRLPSLDAAQIANLTATNGDMIYNTTASKIQGFENGSWGNLI
jgi:hypothetical protein